MARIAKFEFVSEQEFLKSVEDKNIYKALKKPKRATKASAGYDFYAPYSFVLNPGNSSLFSAI